MKKVKSDIRLKVQELKHQQEALLYVHFIEPLPLVPHNEIRYQGQVLNLQTLTCTCEESISKRELITEERDLRVLCKHLLQKLRKYLSPGSLTRVLAEYQHKYGNEHYLFRVIKGRNVYIGFSSQINPPDWLSIYLINDPEQMNYVRFSYSLAEKRWAYGIPPKDAVEIESYLSLLFEKSSRFKKGFSITF